MAEDLPSNPHPDNISGAERPQDAARLAASVQSGVEKPALAQMLQMAMGNISSNPLHSKMTTEHITQVLKLGADHDEREFTLSKSRQEIDANKDWRGQLYAFSALVLVVALVVFLVCILKDNPSVLVPMVSGVAGLASGFAAGVGYGKSKTPP